MLGNLDVGLLPVAGRDFLEVDWVYFYGGFFVGLLAALGFLWGERGK